jgi:hypothetical protein
MKLLKAIRYFVIQLVKQESAFRDLHALASVHDRGYYIRVRQLPCRLICKEVAQGHFFSDLAKATVRAGQLQKSGDAF